MTDQQCGLSPFEDCLSVTLPTVPVPVGAYFLHFNPDMTTVTGSCGPLAARNSTW